LNPQLERWDLATYLGIARELTIISAETSNLGDVARDYRNLIHPGRARRLEKQCDESTAMGAIAAALAVARDLELLSSRRTNGEQT
jgi:hypothetical protein